MSESLKVHTCKICNKKYSSKSSLCNHNKKFHIKDVSKNTPIVSTDSPNVSIKNSLLCKYCAKKFSSTQNKWKHENKVCKKKEEINKIELLQAQVNELTSKINNTTNINNNNNNGTINNNNNNGTINNNIIIGFGKEDVAKLTMAEKKKIIGKGYQAVLALIDTMHFNKKYPEFNNIQITNLRDNCAKIYDDDINDYKTVKKKETIDQLIYNKTFNLGDILEELNDPENKYHKITLKLIDMLQSYSPEMEDKDSLEFYKNLCKDIIFLIYNKTKLLQVTKV
jgi:hypothetical protein